MTMSPGDPGPTDFEGKAAPPYEGRRETADVAGEEELRRDGANVGGATGPVESDERRRRSPRTPRAGRSRRRPTSSRPPTVRAATRRPRRRSARRTIAGRPAGGRQRDEHDRAASRLR